MAKSSLNPLEKARSALNHMIFKDFPFKYDNSYYACASYYPEKGEGGIVSKKQRGRKGNDDGTLGPDYHHFAKGTAQHCMSTMKMKFEWQRDEIKQAGEQVRR
jgi:hypothetical protein